MTWRVLAAAAAMGAGQGAAAQAEVGKAGLLQRFEEFIAEHRKKYLDGTEFGARFEAFVENLCFTEAETAKGTNFYGLGVTAFVDLIREEFRAHCLGYRRPLDGVEDLPRLGTFQSTNVTLPDTVDWRKQGAVTDVKNQRKNRSAK